MRGFTYIAGGTKDDRKLTYWWNGVTTFDGSYERLAVAPKSDCNQTS